MHLTQQIRTGSGSDWPERQVKEVKNQHRINSSVELLAGRYRSRF